MEAPIGERFVRAIAAKDEAGLVALLAPEVDFRAMTPDKFWESNSATEVVNDVVFGRWFDPGDRVESVESIEHGRVVDRERVGYRLRVTNDEGTFMVEQQAYFDVEDGRIAWLRIMCAGYRPNS